MEKIVAREEAAQATAVEAAQVEKIRLEVEEAARAARSEAEAARSAAEERASGLEEALRQRAALLQQQKQRLLQRLEKACERGATPLVDFFLERLFLFIGVRARGNPGRDARHGDTADAAPEASPEEGRGGASAESPLDGAGAAAAAAASQLVGQWPEASPAAASTGGGRLAAVCSAVEAHAASAEGWAAECAALRRRCESAEEGARAALALLAATQRVAAAIAAESLRGRTEGGADAAEGGVADHPAADLSPREHRSLNGSREPPGAEWRARTQLSLPMAALLVSASPMGSNPFTSTVVALTSKNWRELESSPFLWLVNLTPKWEKLAGELKNLVKVAYWDTEANGATPPLLGQIKGTPTIKAFVPSRKSVKNAKNVEEYQQAREVKDLVRFATSRMPNFVERVKTAQELEAAQAAKRREWGLPMVLIFSSSGATSSTLKALSTADLCLAGKGGSEVARRFGVTAFPAVLGFPAGQDEPVAFEKKPTYNMLDGRVGFFRKLALKQAVLRKPKPEATEESLAPPVPVNSVLFTAARVGQAPKEEL
ncbi:hypothetical protein EMIHUDRAFT_226114 [Emiliania huxleyi CCMP1516]|uniref:Thioredoxin domain-containing protein n=4 Tax=Emiliania huxleyi TaxID=2903 RepID=A0A0D3KLH7_EMIH1|nr:hypothetical protein EMIHUDRAFT_226114 [Emiliania huxleyi CCMP1516]EOD36612.1 hypothetical protein EMIHUDRAFT_226114 [Emiliania huxleyi CCMP1516]|eukprot:XP_005789041.1 hypothetical protein EMIHUDRAFT_226114 [Emiliania huxleyi CCMP1516]